jgi:hypothetical protein
LKEGSDQMTVLEMLRTHPAGSAHVETLARCIEACLACAQSCTACSDACLAEADVDGLRRCIRLNLDCADVCDATARVVTRQTELQPDLVRRLLEACAAACRLCAQECEAHARHHDHCRICAEDCRRCESACEDALTALP